MVPTFDQVAAANEALQEHRQVSLMPGISAGPIAGSGLAGESNRTTDLTFECIN
ncbi:MAG: hypothetical protein R2688_04600 [Fimbriimonadaceae bacterium]